MIYNDLIYTYMYILYANIHMYKTVYTHEHIFAPQQILENVTVAQVKTPNPPGLVCKRLYRALSWDVVILNFIDLD